MALVRRFQRSEMQKYQTHEEVEANYYICEVDGKKLLQINTYGRSDRELPGKLSQSLQLDEEGAAKLFEIIREHFGFR